MSIQRRWSVPVGTLVSWEGHSSESNSPLLVLVLSYGPRCWQFLASLRWLKIAFVRTNFQVEEIKPKLPDVTETGLSILLYHGYICEAITITPLKFSRHNCCDRWINPEENLLSRATTICSHHYSNIRKHIIE